ncbi:MAG: hypothetical protein RR678_04255 [Lachnospiraceae bacterium]
MKKRVALILALMLTCSMSMPTFAAAPTTDAGETSVGIQVYDYDPDNLTKSVSFTVPLYVTLAVTQDHSTNTAGSKIIVPAANAYQITNTAKAGASSIAVSKLVVSKIANSDWTLDVAKVPTTRSNFHMSLGTGDNLTDLAVQTFDKTEGFITAASSTNAVKSNAQITPNNGVLPLEIAAAINTGEVYDKKATVPQIKLAYTLQPIGADGKFITKESVKAYVGDTPADAVY